MSILRFVEISSSPLAPGVAPVRLRYRDAGEGPPVVMLHGGWGYEVYPFDRQIEALTSRYRVVIPDRSGYGGSPALDDLPSDFHRRAAQETRAVIDALGLARPILWGHSDGAIVALLVGLADPRRIAGAIVEATHLYKQKPASRAFFESIVASPESLGARASAVMVNDHGDRWRQLVDVHSRAWLRISSEAQSHADDFYGGRLGELEAPVLVIHGRKDPRTEPGELDALRAALEGERTHGSVPTRDGIRRAFAIFEEGGHSPHSERATADAVTQAALTFVTAVLSTDPAPHVRS